MLRLETGTPPRRGAGLSPAWRCGAFPASDSPRRGSAAPGHRLAFGLRTELVSEPLLAELLPRPLSVYAVHMSKVKVRICTCLNGMQPALSKPFLQFIKEWYILVYFFVFGFILSCKAAGAHPCVLCRCKKQTFHSTIHDISENVEW